MDEQKLQTSIKTIEESLLAFRHISLQLRSRKAMLPSLAKQIDANEKRSGLAMVAIAELKKELGL